MFPEPHYDVPIFGADVVSLPGGHLAVLDFQPVVDSVDQTYLNRYYKVLDKAYHHHSNALGPIEGIPEAARPFFSPYYLFARASTEVMVTQVYPAFLDYLGAYLHMWASGQVHPLVDPQAKEAVHARHVAYSQYRAEKDPARGMLTRMYGEEWTERFIHEVLFDLDHK